MRSFFGSDPKELSEKISHIPSCAMSLGLPEGRASGKRNEGLPARVVQNREHRSVSGGRSDFAQRVYMRTY